MRGEQTDAVDVLESYIGDNTKADELYAELQMLAKETDYLYKKIEKICMFKPMNVTHAQLVNLEQSLSELVIEERQLQSFYATDLIKKLIYHVSDKINVLKGKTGQLKGLFLQHEKKLDELIAQRQDDINQFFTIAGFVWIGETVNIAYFTKDHSTIDITDTRNGHDDRIVEFHDIRHLNFNLF